MEHGRGELEWPLVRRVLPQQGNLLTRGNLQEFPRKCKEVDGARRQSRMLGGEPGAEIFPEDTPFSRDL